MIERKRVLDICCGAGGLSYGFGSHKRFALLGGVDNDKSALRTYRRNLRRIKTLEVDVTKLSGETVLDFFGRADVVVCGFPCQIFSFLGKRDLEDPRLEVMYSCLRLIGEIKPEMVVLENVPGLVSFDEGRVFAGILMFLENLGYVVNYEIINAVDYGVPQNRKRLVIVGSKNGKFKFQRRYKKIVRTVGDAWSDMGVVGYESQPLNEFQKWVRRGTRGLQDHEVVVHGESALGRIESGREFGSYKRLEWDKPANTVVGSFGALSGSYSVHPDQNRALTVREAARLQSFPDRYSFCGTKEGRRKQVANSVPPLMARALAGMIWAHYKKEVQGRKSVVGNFGRVRSGRASL